MLDQAGFTTTWDYTILKRRVLHVVRDGVLLPLGITLLSNSPSKTPIKCSVLLPLGITLLSNSSSSHLSTSAVLLPLGITLLSNFHLLLSV